MGKSEEKTSKLVGLVGQLCKSDQKTLKLVGLVGQLCKSDEKTLKLVGLVGQLCKSGDQMVTNRPDGEKSTKSSHPRGVSIERVYGHPPEVASHKFVLGLVPEGRGPFGQEPCTVGCQADDCGNTPLASGSGPGVAARLWDG